MAQFKTQKFTFFAPRTVIFCKKVYYMMLSKRQKMITALIAGVVAGGGLYFLYLLRAHTYLTDHLIMPLGCTALIREMRRVTTAMCHMRIL